MNELGNLAMALCTLNENEAKRLVKNQVGEGVPASQILSQCHAGMASLGKRFDEGDCFIPELILAGKIMEGLMMELEPLLQGAAVVKEGAARVVLGTVQNDIHNIGKDIVAMMLRGSGHEVIDLGIDVAPCRFVEAIQSHKPLVVGMSVLLTTCYKSITNTLEAFRQAGVRDRVAVMVGGAAASQMLADKTGCDFYGQTAVDAVNIVTRVADQKRSAAPANG